MELEDCDYECDKIGIPEDLRPKCDWVVDSVSLMQGSGGANLDIWYNDAYVSGETHIINGNTAHINGNMAETSIMLERTPVLIGSLTGQIFKDNALIYNFHAHSSGLFAITMVGNPCVDISPALNITGYYLNNATGILGFNWASPPGTLKFIVNYEYNCDIKV